MRLNEAQELLDPFAIKPHHRLAVNERHRGGLEAKLHKLLQCSLVRPDVFDDIRDALLRKKLFLPVARPSPGLRIDHHVFRHRRHLRPATSLEDPRNFRLAKAAYLTPKGALYGIDQLWSTNGYERAGRFLGTRHCTPEATVSFEL